jgi:hypothetical protein
MSHNCLERLPPNMEETGKEAKSLILKGLIHDFDCVEWVLELLGVQFCIFAELEFQDVAGGLRSVCVTRELVGFIQYLEDKEKAKFTNVI